MSIGDVVTAVRSRSDRRALLVFWGVLGAVVLVHARGHGQPAAVSAWLTVFVAICVQASPYVTLGALAAAVLRRLPERLLTRAAALPSPVGVPVLATCGALVPGCECGSVGVAATMVRRGIRAGPALAFMTSAPAVNPVVLAATVAAFPGRPGLVAARAGASVAAAVVLGWLWPRVAGSSLPSALDRHDHGLAAELARGLGLLVLGAAAAAAVSVLVPPSALDAVSSTPASAVAGCAVAAVVMSVCSAADAFVAASFTRFSVTAQLAFMVVGPVVDLKLIAMYAGTFGRAMVVRFVPLALAATLSASVAAATVLGWLTSPVSTS